MQRPVSGPVLVTGATGFIGSHLVERLLERGHDVRCLVREPSRLRWIQGLPVQIMSGDCSVPGSLADAVRDASVIYHVAGLTKALRVRDYYEANQRGTRNLVEACARHARSLSKFILVSSLAAAGPGREGAPISAGDAPRPVTDYGRSKLLAEEEALRMADRTPVVIVRPTAVYGPRDTDVYVLFRWASRGIILNLAGGQRFLQWCYVGDLTELLLLAGERPVPSGSILYAAEERIYSTAETTHALVRSGRVAARTVTIPVGIGHLVGALSELAGWLRGQAPILNRQKVREAAQRSWTCDVTKAREELGFVAGTPLEEGFKRTWQWYRAAGWVR